MSRCTHPHAHVLKSSSGAVLSAYVFLVCLILQERNLMHAPARWWLKNSSGAVLSAYACLVYLILSDGVLIHAPARRPRCVYPVQHLVCCQPLAGHAQGLRVGLLLASVRLGHAAERAELVRLHQGLAHQPVRLMPLGHVRHQRDLQDWEGALCAHPGRVHADHSCEGGPQQPRAVQRLGCAQVRGTVSGVGGGHGAHQR